MLNRKELSSGKPDALRGCQGNAVLRRVRPPLLAMEGSEFFPLNPRALLSGPLVAAPDAHHNRPVAVENNGGCLLRAFHRDSDSCSGRRREVMDEMFSYPLHLPR